MPHPVLSRPSEQVVELQPQQPRAPAPEDVAPPTLPADFSVYSAPQVVSTLPTASAVTLAAPPRVSRGVQEGKVRRRVDPLYPAMAKSARIEGTVVLNVTVGKTGDVEKVAVVSGPPMLASAAEDAVRRWKYDPWLVDGVPSAVDTQVVVKFTLPR